MKAQRIICFLDFDGVLNVPVMDMVDPLERLSINRLNSYTAICNLNYLALKYNMDIVITSSWRSIGFAKCYDILYDSGLDGKIRVISMTPSVESGAKSQNRGDEIAQWIADNPELAKKYIILDDDSDFTIEQNKHLVRCNTHYGFQLKELVQAERMLTLMSSWPSK